MASAQPLEDLAKQAEQQIEAATRRAEKQLQRAAKEASRTLRKSRRTARRHPVAIGVAVGLTATALVAAWQVSRSR